jgi:hypothetical protein
VSTCNIAILNNRDLECIYIHIDKWFAVSFGWKRFNLHVKRTTIYTLRIARNDCYL